MIWKTSPNLEVINQVGQNALPAHLGMEFTAIGDDWLEATMPVDHRTVQPMRLLHGGASVAFAETLGSVASMLMLEDLATQSVVGVEINANHLNSVKEGDQVRGVVKPLKLGRTLHVWEIHIFRGDGQLACVSRITIAVVTRR
ncbi:MAG: hotdog fold thioesterase [Saprospiraceae bacterium]